MFQNKRFRQPNQVREDNQCEIEVKKTAQGKRIRFKGKCSKEELGIFSEKRDVDFGEE